MVYKVQNRNIVKIDFIVAFLLLAAGVLLFPLKGVVPSPDSSWYLNNAIKIYNDLNYENLMIRRPLFPFLISLSFHIFGKSIESAFWVVRLFFVLNILLAYFMGLKLFSRTTGIAFSLFLLSSYVINQWSSYLLVDAIIPFFVLLYILTLYQAFENENRSLFVLSGLILGLAFLVKGVFSILFLFLPIFLFLEKKYRTRNQVENVFYVLLSTILVLSPWLLYCIFQNDFFVLVGPMFKSSEIKASGVVPLISSKGFSLGSWAVDQFMDARVFFKVYIGSKFVYSGLFVFSFIYCLGKFFFNKKRSFFYLFIPLVLFSPVIYIGMKSGGMNFRAGQFMVLFFLLYLMSAFMVADISNAIAGYFFKGSKEKTPGRILFSVFLGLCLFFQVFTAADDARGFSELLKRDKIKNFYGFSLWQGSFNSKDGWANETTREAAEWISKHIPGQEIILCQWYYLNMLDYLTENQYDFQFVEHSFFHENIDKKAIFLWPRYNFHIMEGNSLVAIYEENLLAQVNKDRVQYIVVTARRNFLTLYLQGHPDFEQIHSITRGRWNNIKIFKTQRFPVSPDSTFSVKFHEDIYNFFQLAAKENKLVFDYQKNVMKQILNWNDDQLEFFVSNVTNPDPEMFWQVYEKVKPRTIY